MKYRLTKLSDNPGKLRTQSVEGALIQPPVVGFSVIIVGEALEPGFNSREVTTSTVVKVEGNKFWTLNSEYMLEEIENDRP